MSSAIITAFVVIFIIGFLSMSYRTFSLNEVRIIIIIMGIIMILIVCTCTATNLLNTLLIKFSALSDKNEEQNYFGDDML